LTNVLGRFEQVVRGSPAPLARERRDPEDAGDAAHPFESRNIHPDLPRKVRRLFDDGYFSESTFEAFKWLEKEVRRLSGSKKFGKAMMMEVFNEENGVIAFSPQVEQSEIDEQIGYKFMFAGSQSAIRNPRGHHTDNEDSLDQCLDHLALASLLIRRLDATGLRSKV
jgi:uncharacterized protein (TIGR02391 family)